MTGCGSASSTVVQWGKAQVGTTSSYESMCFKGVWYNLHDNVFCRSGRTKPYVGKLMRLYEEDGVGKVRIRWFFRPEELPLFVRKDFPSDMLQSKELFIGLGSGVGVENENLVEVICGQAMVLCTARIKDNPLPSSAHIENTHHFFNRAYDVGKKKLVRIVEKMCNKHEWMVPIEKGPTHSGIEDMGKKHERMVPIEKGHSHSSIEDMYKACVASEEENNSCAQDVASGKEVKEESLHAIDKAKASDDMCTLSTISSSKIENIESVVSVTNLGGKKRILLKTLSIMPVVSFKKKKVKTW